ncbi:MULTISPECIES: DUF3085 domain-containing protein [Nocardia]|uniref:DUF3085 domain-containing protein n=1 Tax=Nocardia TaxID=1817 RepID=UPI001300ABD4|nr:MULTISPECIES: DUF3085 domain-containing protein [Nocardia]
MSLVDLWFRLADVAPLAEHAMTAPEHAPTPFAAPGPTGPALFWVKDRGVYVLSNGKPRQPPESGGAPGQARVVYAHGHEPGTHWYGGTLLGDDFVEALSLTEPTLDGTTIIALIRDYAARDGWMVFTVFADRFETSFSDTGPTT